MTLTRKVYIDWDQDGSFPDMSHDVVSGGSALGSTDWRVRVADVGIVTLELKNDQRQYSPDNTAGPYYGKLVPNIPVRIEVTDDTGTYRVATVWTSDFIPHPGQYSDLRCTLTCIDRMGQLQNGDLSLPIQEGQTTGAIFRRVTSTVYQSGQAAATIYMREVQNNDTLTIGDTVYTYKDTLTPAANEIAIASQPYFYGDLFIPANSKAITDFAVNAAVAINRDEGNGTHYAAPTLRNLAVTALGYAGVGWDESQYDSDLYLQRTGTAYSAIATSFYLWSYKTYYEPQTLPISRVYVYLKKVGNPTGTLTLKLEPWTASSKPSDTLYDADATGTLSEASLTTSFAWYAIDFASEVTIEQWSNPGIKRSYALVLETDRATDGSHYVVWGRDSATSLSRFGQHTKAGGTWSSVTVGACPLFYIPGVLKLTAASHGAWGNSLALAQTGDQIVLPGAALSGGVDGPAGALDADDGIVTLDYAGDTWTEGETNGMTGVGDVVYSEFGRAYANKNGTVVFRDQQYDFEQTNATAALTIPATGRENLTGMNGRLSIEDIINRVTISYEPRAALASSVIAKANKPIFVTGTMVRTDGRWNAYASKNPTWGERVVIIPYVTTDTGDRVGGLGIEQPLIAGTDYEVWGTKDKTGPNATYLGLMKFALALVASGVQVQVTNTAGRWGWVHDLQIRGNGLYRQDTVQDVREDSTSRSAYGLKAYQYEIPFPSANSENFAEVLAWYFINRFKAPQYMVFSLTFRGTETLNGVSLFALDIGDVISVSETQTAITDQKYLIIGIDTLLPENDVHTLTFHVMQLNSATYWQVGTSGFSEMGVTTTLAL